MSPRVSTRLLATQSDARLVELVRRGHERAFEALVQRYRRPLLRYCARLGLCDGRAEDALQHALLQAWLALQRQAEVRELRPWLFRIVHNAALNMLRSAPERNGSSLESAAAGVAIAAEPELDQRQAAREALSGVAALPQMQRQAMLLSALGGQSHGEVAELLGISDGAVRGLLYRARSTLRAAAAALTPQPLVSWACGLRGGAGPSVERLIDLSGSAGAAGMTGVLAKGAAVAVTAAAVVGGAVVVPAQRHRAHPASAKPRLAGAPARGAAGTAASGRSAGLTGRGRVAPSGLPRDAGRGGRARGHGGASRTSRGSEGGLRSGRETSRSRDRGGERESLTRDGMSGPGGSALALNMQGSSSDGGSSDGSPGPSLSSGSSPGGAGTGPLSGSGSGSDGSDGHDRSGSGSSGGDDGSTQTASSGSGSDGGAYMPGS